MVLFFVLCSVFRLAKKQELGVMTDREGILYDLAMVMANETLFPVAKMQTMIAELHPRSVSHNLSLQVRAVNGCSVI